MNGKGSHRTPNLFVVKGAEPSRRISGTEALSAEQCSIVEDYKRLSHSEGVIVGVVHGKAEWDLRPLLLAQGRIWILRYSDPMLHSYPEMEGAFTSLLRVLDVEKNITAAVTTGHTGMQHWVKRLYFDETLADILQSGQREKVGQRDILVRSLILEVARLHRIGLPHGHLAPSNVALVDNFPCIFDFGFLSATPVYTAADSAPEIQAGGFASHASDIYGLGLLLKNIMPQPFSEQAGGFLERMTSVEPSLRPAIEEVRYFFEAPYGGRASPAKQANLSGARGSVLHRGPAGVEQGLPEGHPPAVSEAASAAVRPKSIKSVAAGGLILICLVALFQFRHSIFRGGESQENFQEYWASGVPSLMKVVADAAVNDEDRLAQAVIIRSTISGNSKVLADLFRVAFDPRWEEQLSDTDRTFILSIALKRMLQYDVRDMPPLSRMHPAVILALASSFSLDSEGRQFEAISLKSLEALPGALGTAFRNLESEGVENMEELPARALSHLVVGNVSQAALAGYFNGCNEIPVCLARLSTLVPLSSYLEGFDLTLHNRLPVVVPVLQPLLSWFTDEDLAQWSSLKPIIRLSLLTGTYPENQSLTFEQVADLLRFPLPNIRQEAVKSLISEFGLDAVSEPFLVELSSVPKGQAVTRAQSISIVSSLLTKGQQAFTFIEQWFSTIPNPQVVLRLLISRAKAGAMDPFSLEAARYLSQTEWSAGLQDLQKLVEHDEPLARALAYNKLRIDADEELEILQKMADVEGNPRNRELIRLRLQSAAILAGANH